MAKHESIIPKMVVKIAKLGGFYLFTTGGVVLK
jgi:hypothetical protein